MFRSLNKFSKIIKAFWTFFCATWLFYFLSAASVSAGTATFNVAAGADDVNRTGTSGFSTTSPDYVAGVSGGNVLHSAMRFTNINIPQGSTINSAYFTLIALSGSAGDAVLSNIFTENVDNATQITSAADFDGRILTAGTVWDNIAAWTTGSPYNSPDISSEIQAVVNRPGWVSGNAMNIFWKDDGSSNNAFRRGASWDNTTYTEPRLTITWTEPGPDTTPPSTSIASVEGDTASPYTDALDDGDTQILINGESGMLCRWYDSDTAYAASLGTSCPVSGTQATCSVPTATGSYTKYVSCADSLGNGQTIANNLDVSWDVSIAPPSFDFSLAANPITGTATQGSNVNTTITAALSSGAALPVSFSVSGLPAGASPSFSPASCSPTCSSVLTISTTPTTAAGTYPLTITGTDGSLSKTTSYSLTVNATPVSGDETIVGALSLAATYESISVYANFSSDNNQNNSASFQWRESGGVWKQGMTMTVDRRTTVTAASGVYTNPYVNQWRASIIGVQPNTSYQVEVTFADADGITGTNPISTTITTRNDVIPLGTGNTYYVSPTGNDSNPGTEAQPLLTIQRAANLVQAGDTVYIKAGIYPEQITLTRSGTANNWITFLNYGSDVVTIDGEGVRENFRFGGAALDSGQAQYVRVRGLRFINSNFRAITINRNSSDIVIEDSYIANFADNAIWIGGSQNNPAVSQNIVIQRNEISRTTPKAPGSEGHMISFWRTQGGHIIRDNSIVSNWFAPGTYGYFDCIGGGSNFGLDGFVNKDTDIYNNYLEGCSDDGIEAEGGDINVRIWNNTIKNTYIGIAYAPIIVGPLYVFKNTIEQSAPAERSSAFKLGQSSTGLGYIYHNTYYSAGPYDGFKQTNPGLQNIVSRNNIIHAGRYVIEFTGGGSTHNFNYDALYTSDPGRFIKWDGGAISYATFQSLGQELNGMNISATNEFVDPASSNFNLKSTSQFIDRGAALAGFNDANSPWPYRGASPDLGAYEYDSGTPSFNFGLSAVPSSGAVTQGQNITSTISLSLSAGSTQSVTLSASGLPSGATASFSPTSCNPTCSSTMTINTLASTPVGTYQITITGIAGATARTASYSLTVNASAPSSFTVSNVSPLYLLRDKATSALSITGSNFNLATNFTLGLSATSTYNFTVQAQTSSSFNVSLTTSQIGTAAIGLYDLILTRTTDSQSQTYSQKILITVLGDVSSPTAGQRDGKINIYDVSRLLSKWGSVLPADLAEADINSGPGNISQGRIDLYDANLLMRNWRP